MSDAETLPDESTPDFETALAELERLVGRLESGQLKLEDALQSYERGIHLLAGCKRLLDRAERRVEVLTGLDEQGRPRTREFKTQDANGE